MTQEEFEQALKELTLIGDLAAHVDTEGFIAHARHAVDVGFLFVAPMAYQTASARLRPMIELADAVQKVAQAFEKLRAVTVETAPAAAVARQLDPGIPG